MADSPAGRIEVVFRRFIEDKPIRWKLAAGFGVLIVLGLLNIAVYYWGAHQRSDAWEAVQRAIERQTIIVEVQNGLANQKKYVDLLAGVIGVQDQAPPSDLDERQFARAVDTVATRLLGMAALVDPDRRAEIEALYEKTDRLADSWKRFYTLQWTAPTEAIEELYVTAEPLSEELISGDLPEAVEYERQAMAAISAEYVQTEQTFARIAWISFLLSALFGGGFAFYVSRNLLQSISALKTGTERIGGGELNHRIEVRSRDELGMVASSFNEMSDRLKQRTDELAMQRDKIEAQRDNLTETLARLRATQANLVQQEKLASLGALTAGIAHEIKNPLNFINNFAALCKELVDELRDELKKLRFAEKEPVTAILADLETNAIKIKEHGQRADTIIKSMLLHSRGKSGDRQKADLNALLDEYVTLAYHGMRAHNVDFDVRLERTFDPKVGEVEMIPQELGRVFINLIHNAFYAVNEKSSQRGPSADYEPRVVVRTRHQKDGVEIAIADNGNGIPQDVIDRVFEPFFTTKPSGDGTGLGLSLSYDIVTQLHGGSIEVKSTWGEGAEFVIVLPIETAGRTSVS